MDAGPAQLTDATRAEALVAAFAAAADPERAAPMARYMKNQFRVLRHSRARASRVTARGARPMATRRSRSSLRSPTPCGHDPNASCSTRRATCWSAGRRTAPLHCSTTSNSWITTRSWWDSVDSLAHAVGNLLRTHPELASVMDGWIDADNFWLARVALLHQLSYKDATDSDRLFRYCAAPRRRHRVLHPQGDRLGAAGVLQDRSRCRGRVRRPRTRPTCRRYPGARRSAHRGLSPGRGIGGTGGTCAAYGFSGCAARHCATARSHTRRSRVTLKHFGSRSG